MLVKFIFYFFAKTMKASGRNDNLITKKDIKYYFRRILQHLRTFFNITRKLLSFSKKKLPVQFGFHHYEHENVKEENKHNFMIYYFFSKKRFSHYVIMFCATIIIFK